jgi:class 3 adenylate cyclase
MLISVALTMIAATLGLVFALLVSAGISRPVRRLLEGARAVEAGRLDGALVATSQDEIGQLTTAFNQMVEQLRLKERLRETFGKYVDPRVVEGLIEGPALAAEGQRRVMTVLFCDARGFASTSEGMTPQGLVKVMNRYFSTMSAPIRAHQGIIDKYIGDASWPIGDRPSPTMPSRRDLQASQHSTCWSTSRNCAPSFPNCSAFARFPTRSISASASPPARYWSAASAPN